MIDLIANIYYRVECLKEKDFLYSGEIILMDGDEVIDTCECIEDFNIRFGEEEALEKVVGGMATLAEDAYREHDREIRDPVYVDSNPSLLYGKHPFELSFGGESVSKFKKLSSGELELFALKFYKKLGETIE